jgi:hypothetical protein
MASSTTKSPKASPTGKPDKPPRKGPPKLTIQTTVELDFRLSSVAKAKGITKQQFATKLIDQGLRGYKIDESLRAMAAEMIREIESAA